MSKFVKNLITRDMQRRFDGVQDALLVSLSGLDANKNSKLRKTLRDKKIQLLVMKNSLGRRAAEGTPLAAAFEEMEGSLAIVWGGEDIISLAKEVVRLAEDKEFVPFQSRGGVMDGGHLTADQVKEVSKWPTREEQLSLLMGQILSPGANLVGALLSAGANLASQIKQKGEEEENAEGAPAEEAAAT